MTVVPFFEKRWQIFAPVDRAQRCIDVWLREEGREMRRQDRHRLAGLIARYFHYEEDVNDQMVLSFLRHYAGNKAIDMDDPAAVREEIKALLDRSTPQPVRRGVFSYRALLAVTAVLAVVMLFVAGAGILRLPMTAAQQQSLKARVQGITAQQPDLAAATVWARIRKPLGVRRYQEITFWQYDDAMRALAEIDRGIDPR